MLADTSRPMKTPPRSRFARTILLAMMAHKDFIWPAKGPQDWRIRGDDWPSTRYEQKAIREGRPRYYFRFERA